MKLPFFKLFESVRASYWFLPSIMAVLAIALGAGMVWLDAGPGANWLNELGWYQKAKPDGAHQVLSTIAGSMITVAGVVFSITIVAIAYAASQYGPRILTNFMSDRGNQVTLGTFIATFVYCLVVLRTIRGGEDGGFVPQIAVMVGLLLALCSIAVLIYFIHHVPNSIHINNVVAHIGRQLKASVGERFPTRIGDAPEEQGNTPDRSLKAAAMLKRESGEAAVLRSRANGYIQSLDEDAIMEAASRADLLVRLRHKPGDFVYEGQALAHAWPAASFSDEIEDALRSSFSVGTRRTPYGDLTFLVDELVEIAARALSSGVNDPYTAMTCLDWLGAGASELAGRHVPSSRRVDEKGNTRVIALPETFGDFVERGFGRMRQYLARDMNAAVHALATLRSVAESCRSEQALDALAGEAEKLRSMFTEELHGAALDRTEEEAAKLIESLQSLRKIS